MSIASARTINYVRERRRRLPWLRDLVRRAVHPPRQDRVRVHHFIPGIGLAFAAGAGAILKRDDGLEFWLALPFGTGAGLTLDEIAVLAELNNPYWESEKLALAQAALAALAAGTLGIRFHRGQAVS